MIAKRSSTFTMQLPLGGGATSAWQCGGHIPGQGPQELITNKRSSVFTSPLPLGRGAMSDGQGAGGLKLTMSTPSCNGWAVTATFVASQNASCDGPAANAVESMI